MLPSHDSITILSVMKRALVGNLGFTLVLAACASTPDYSRALPEGAPALLPLEPGEPIPDLTAQWNERDDIAVALENSIDWTRRKHAASCFPMAGITHERALKSLERFRQMLAEATSPEDFQDRLENEFQFFKSAGWDGRGGGVLFTAYCTPILRGNLTQDATYRFPLYRLPDDLKKRKDGSVEGWETSFGMIEAYPSRHAIEAGHILEGLGLELVWLADPIDAFLAHVNGSAFIELPSGELFRCGYAGKNGREYTSLGKELEADGKIEKGHASLRRIREWAANASEEERFDYLHRNESFVFFTEIAGNPHGSLDVEVTGERSLATDKTLFPRGALVFVDASGRIDAKQKGKQNGATVADPIQELMLDQDTGGAIRTAGRADIYLGIGPEAEERSGSVKLEGQLYYLFVKE